MRERSPLGTPGLEFGMIPAWLHSLSIAYLHGGRAQRSDHLV